MAITEADVRHVAVLARLSLTDEQVSRLTSELSAILGHIDTIQKLDLEGVEPTAHPLDMTDSTRPDVVKPCLPRELALLNAPEAEDGAFVIPRIVGVGGEG
ncbi:MAG: Asp-tRNA(Asn)/Glu-tRNA(Gln) amidotransferase subunit GatC [Coriobacteriia bacterium]